MLFILLLGILVVPEIFGTWTMMAAILVPLIAVTIYLDKEQTVAGYHFGHNAGLYNLDHIGFFGGICSRGIDQCTVGCFVEFVITAGYCHQRHHDHHQSSLGFMFHCRLPL